MTDLKINGLSSEDHWGFENGFYWFSDVTRLAKVISHWEIIKQTANVPGDIFEFGVFKATSFIRLCTFRDLLEPSHSKKIIGFDIFGKFPINNDTSEVDKNFALKHDEMAGYGLDLSEAKSILKRKKFSNISLVKGDVFETLPKYLEDNPHTKISLLHLDMDIYDPTKFVLENLWDRVVPGGIVMLDDYNYIEGGTRAIDEFFLTKEKISFKKSYTHVPSYIIKK